MDELALGSTFAGLEIQRRIGGGGMGAVYLAEDPKLRRRVALKVIASHLAADARYRDRFLVEARLAAQLEHAAIVPIYGMGEEQGSLYLAMRYMEDGSLADRLESSGALEASAALAMLRPIAAALDAAHRAGLVHRDVKPGNILLTGDDALLADFGLALPIGGGAGALSAEALGVSGTVGYLAPEQIEGDETGPAADQYSLACVAFECLTGRQPYTGSTDLKVIYAHLVDPPPSISAVRPELPRAADGVFARALAKQPDARFRSCSEMLGDLSRAVGLLSPAPKAVRHRGRSVAAAAALLAVLAAIGATIVHRHSGPHRAAAAAAAGDAVSAIDPAAGRVVARLPVGSTPLDATAGDGKIWVLSAGDGTITPIDAASGQPASPVAAAVDGTPVGVAFGSGVLWVATGRNADLIDFGTITDSVVRIDPSAPGDRRPLSLPGARHASQFHQSGRQIAFGAGSVWVVDPDGSIGRIDPAAPTRVTRIAMPGHGTASAIAAGEAGVFAVGVEPDESGSPQGPYLFQIDARSGTVDTSRVATTGVSDIAVGDGAVWLADPWDGKLIEVQPGPQHNTRTITTSAGTSRVAFDGPAGWVANPSAGTVAQVNAAAGRLQRSVSIAGAPQALAFAGSRVWVSTIGTLHAQSAAGRPAVGDVVQPGCRTVFHRPSVQPDYLIVGDFPFDVPSTRVDSDAVASVLEQAGFRAGRYTVGYEVCDDRAGDDATCHRFAQAYAANQRVIGVITGYYSTCAATQLPTLARASVPTAGPQNTDPSLTRAGFRDYVRVIPTERDGVRAGLGLLRASGSRSPIVLYEGYGIPVISRIRDLAVQEGTAMGIHVAASMGYPVDGSVAAGRVRRAISVSKADGVYLVGFPDAPTVALLAVIRAAAPRATIVASDMISQPAVSDLAATPAAVGILIASAYPMNGNLPRAGQQWLRAFAATQPGGQVPSTSLLAAAAAQAMLDAIGRSNGTRASATAELGATHLQASVIGPLTFTPNGDVATPCALALYRIEGSTFRAPDIASDFQGTRYLRNVPCDRRSATG